MLRAALGDDDPDKVKAARPFLYSHKQLKACASFPAIGELVHEVITQRRHLKFLDVMGALEQRIRRGDLATYGLGLHTTKVFEIASDLRRRDYKLEVTDSLIVACAFEDPLCQVFYTVDAQILQSSMVRDEAKRRGKKVLPIG